MRSMQSLVWCALAALPLFAAPGNKSVPDLSRAARPWQEIRAWCAGVLCAQKYGAWVHLHSCIDLPSEGVLA